MASGQGARAADALLLARLVISSRVVESAIPEDVALKDGQVLGVSGIASVGLRLVGHEGVKAAVALTQVQSHDVGHEQHRQDQSSLGSSRYTQ